MADAVGGYSFEAVGGIRKRELYWWPRLLIVALTFFAVSWLIIILVLAL
jgi:hypothetical protein